MSSRLASVGPAPANLHTLRRYGVAALLARGVPVTDIARILGHSSPRITRAIVEAIEV